MKIKKNIRFKYSRFSMMIIVGYAFIALLAPFLANEKPLYYSIHGKKFFPAFSNNPYVNLPDSNGIFTPILSNNIDWKNLAADTKIFPPIAWSPIKSDLANVLVSPLDEQVSERNGRITKLPVRFRHFLGTGKTGATSRSYSSSFSGGTRRNAPWWRIWDPDW